MQDMFSWLVILVYYVAFLLHVVVLRFILPSLSHLYQLCCVVYHGMPMHALIWLCMNADVLLMPILLLSVC